MPKPKTVLCYICGRDFGPHSINVHERQCAKRWEAERKKQTEVENEKEARKRKTSKSKIDPWKVDTLPPIRGHDRITRSLHDIRMPSRGEPHATESEKDFMHTVRPQTVTLKGQRQTGESAQPPTSETANSKPDIGINDNHSPTLARPSTVTLDQGSGNAGLENETADTNDSNDADLSSVARPGTVTLENDDSNLPNGHTESSDSESKTGEVPPYVTPTRPATVTLRKHLPASVLPSRVSATDFMNKKSGAKSVSPVNSTLDGRPGTATLRKHSAPEPSIQTSRNSSPLSSTSSDSQGPNMSTVDADFPNMSAPRFRSTKNPNMLVCYICGNEYGSKSLKIHEPQCLKKWKLANPRYYSRKGNSGGMFKANSVNMLHSTAKNAKLLHQNGTSKTGKGLPGRKTSIKSASCENLLDSSHKTEGGSLQALRELSRSQGRLTPPRKPQMVPCYICGKEFIKHSLQVHEKQCLKKWDAAKAKNEKEKKLAKTENAPSKRHSIALPITIKIDKAEDLKNNNLENVAVTSNSERNDEKPTTTVTVQSTPKARKTSTVTCYICGRAYGSASISIHEKQCQKKWDAQVAKQAEEEKFAKKGSKKSRPRSFVL